MKTFVVNMERRPDRRERMERIVPRSWNAEYTTDWPGPTDGARIRPGDLGGFTLFDWRIESDNAWWNRPLKLGEIGCAISHWLIWRRALELGEEPALILEDDVSLIPRVERRLDAGLLALEDLDPRWDLVYLGRWALEPQLDERLAVGIVRPAYSYCTFGYMLSPRGLSKLLDVGYEHALIPVDELLPALYMPHPRQDVRRRYRPCLRAYAFDPPLVTQLPKEVAGSDTEATPFAGRYA